jgi:uncharacterized protein (DUF2147 family)
MKLTGSICLALLAALYTGDVRAASESVFGFWLIESQRSIIEIVPCGRSACGKIVWLKEPLDDDGRPRIDHLNGDDELRGRRLCGMELIKGFSSSDLGEWSGGSIYSPKEGKTYSALMNVRDDGTLKLRGYLLLPLLGKTQVWTRAAGDRGGC